MTKAEPHDPWQAPVLRQYWLLCLGALLVLTLALVLRGLEVWALLPILVGSLSLAFRWRSGPVIPLAMLAWVLYSERTGWTLFDLLESVFVQPVVASQAQNPVGSSSSQGKVAHAGVAPGEREAIDACPVFPSNRGRSIGRLQIDDDDLPRSMRLGACRLERAPQELCPVVAGHNDADAEVIHVLPPILRLAGQSEPQPCAGPRRIAQRKIRKRRQTPAA